MVYVTKSTFSLPQPCLQITKQPSFHPKMEQGGIILNWTKDVTAARTFRDFVLSEHGREVLKRYGFFLPEK
jgi:ABC-type molybdate transport system substrate-binding protein